MLVRREAIELPGLAGGGIERGARFPVFPAVIMPGAGGDDRLAGGKGWYLLVAPVAGEEPGLDAMVGLPDDQQMAAVLLKNHRMPSSMDIG
jgi:hypothetical protein